MQDTPDTSAELSQDTTQEPTQADAPQAIEGAEDTTDSSQEAESKLNAPDDEDLVQSELPFLDPPSEVDNGFNTPTLEQIKELKAQIQEAIKEDRDVFLNTHYTLLGIAELLSLSEDFFNFYSYQCENLKLNNAHYNAIKNQMIQVANFVNNSLISLNATHQAAHTLYEQCEGMLDTAQEEISNLNKSLLQVQETIHTLEGIKSSMVSIEDLRNALRAQVSQAQLLKDQITALSNTLLQEMQVALLSDKENYERELGAKKDEYVKIFDERLGILQEKMNDFDSAWITREAKCEETISRIESFLQKLVEYEHQVRIEQENRLKELESATHTHKEDLSQHTQEHITTLEDFKAQKCNDLAEFEKHNEMELSLYENTLRASLERVKTDFLRDINALNVIQIQEIKELFYQIANDKATLGSAYESISFAQNGIFTPINGILDYFVFVRGGEGDTLGKQSGGISSFGSYLSANGGAGNLNGNGQRGEAKSAFVRLENDTQPIPIIVSTGGVCVVSYASSERMSVDTSFLSQKDKEILCIVYDKSEAELMGLIDSKAQANKIRNILAIAQAIYLGQELEEAYIPMVFHGTTYNEPYALKCAIALAFLDTNTAITELLSHILPAPTQEVSEEKERESEEDAEDTTEPSEETSEFKSTQEDTESIE